MHLVILHPSILPPAMGKIEGRSGLFMATDLGEGKPIKLRTRVNLLSHPLSLEGFGNLLI